MFRFQGLGFRVYALRVGGSDAQPRLHRRSPSWFFVRRVSGIRVEGLGFRV